MAVPAPEGSDLSCDLSIEEVGGEVTILFDVGHVHMAWPPAGEGAAPPRWRDPLLLVDAILAEEVVCSSGWIDGELRVASLHDRDREPALRVPRLQRLRVRSWHGRHDRDEVL